MYGAGHPDAGSIGRRDQRDTAAPRVRNSTPTKNKEMPPDPLPADAAAPVNGADGA